MYRKHHCGELNKHHIGMHTTLAGWVAKNRDLGGMTFIDLRDRYGITQLVFNMETNPALCEQARSLGREYVIQVEGVVAERSNKNRQLATGEIEIIASAINILSAAALPPFTIEADTDGGDEIRMKYRYLDLRRAPVMKNLQLRYAVNRAARNFLHEQGFMDIETPYLIKSTPEGARDFIVPSRMNPGQFYALPQSPQTFKQLLMISGYDKYYQIVKCFRDEDLRADRQPEFTQIDCEMSFVEQEDILQTFEAFIKSIFLTVKGIDMQDKIARMTWDDAMWHYGNDKPDIRFDMKIANLKSEEKCYHAGIENTAFKVFEEAETVLAIAVPGAAEYSRKQTDELIDWVKRPQIGMGGLAFIKHGQDGSLKSSFDKFFTEPQLKELAAFCHSAPGDLILILAGTEEKTRKAISTLRLEMAERLGLRKKDEFKLLWVTDFPLFEYAEEENRWVARHHPFTAPKPEDIPVMIQHDPHIANAQEYLKHPYAKIKANAYDLVLNGHEIAGGSIRIFQKDLQTKMFEALRMSKEEQENKFGFLLSAFEYGAPPHGGIAFGFDRLVAILGGSETIRDFMAFPKNNAGRDVMIDTPSEVDHAQLKELGLAK